MVTNVTYPSLSEDGWVNNPAKIGDYLLSCFFVADFSQSYIHSGRISSFPWILTDTQGDISRTVSVTREILQSYFSRYFSSVDVEVQEVPNVEEPSKGQLSIYVRYTGSDNVAYVLGKLLQYQNTKIEKIIALNNG